MLNNIRTMEHSINKAHSRLMLTEVPTIQKQVAMKE